MGIKYEAVFGDQGLFDRNDAPEDCEIIGDCCYKVICGEVNVWNFSEKRWCDHYKSSFLCLAMRRIIRAPTWTVADQNAGKLPEVGCRVNFCHKLNTNWRTGEIKYIDDQVVVIKADDVARPFVYEVERVEYKPIETPAQKAQREEDEFVDSLKSVEIHAGVFFNQGARAAYRKLKGGE